MSDLLGDLDVFKFVVGFCLGGIVYAAYQCLITLQKVLKELEAIRHFTKQSAQRSARDDE